MVKSEEEVLSDFKELINMTADELEAFLKTDESNGSTGAGWQKSDGSGESVGHESGRKIVEMLKKNPDKDPSKWDEDDKAHARKVVSYCKRHLAQEEHMKETKTPEELEKTRSTISLKNWGHDPLKTLEGSSSSAQPASKKAADKPKSKKAEESEAAEKPKSKKEDSKPKSSNGKTAAATKKADTDDKEEKTAEKPKSKGKAAAASAEDKEEEKKDSEDAEAGEKRKDDAPAKSDKPASKKAKTTKPAAEPTRKPPSRSAKKA